MKMSKNKIKSNAKVKRGHLYGKIHTLPKKQKKTKKTELSWNEQASKELHRPIQHNFETRKIFVSTIDSMWASDLIDLQKYGELNNDFKWILVIVDAFSRYFWLRALKNKKQSTVKNAFQKIFETGVKPKRCILTDNGTEYVGKLMQNFWKANNILLIHNYGPHKSSLAENSVKIVKGLLFRLMTTQNTHNWFQFLEKIETEHNTKKKHRVLKMTPINARLPINNYKVIKANLKKRKIKKNRKKPPKFRKGDLVRIAKSRHVFTKAYEERWSREQFIIREKVQSRPTTYLLEDLHKEYIIGSFYGFELQKSQQKVFFHNVKKQRKNKITGRNDLFVNWEGWSSKHDQWIDEKNVEDPV